MKRRQTVKDFKNINEIVQNNDAIKTKACKWEQLFEKYSNINDKEEDGILLDEHVKRLEMEASSLDDEDEPDFYLEDEAEVDKTEDASETISVAEFQKMSQKQRFDQLTYNFSPKLLTALKKVFDQKVAEVERMNLPFWNFTSEKSRVEESLKEDFFHTPKVSFGSRRFLRLAEVDRRQFNAIPSTTEMLLNQVKINGQPSFLESNAGSNELPLSVRKLLEMNSNVTIKIREREYDIQVGERNVSGLTDRGPRMGMLQDAPTLENIKTEDEDNCIFIDSSNDSTLGDENTPDNRITRNLTTIDEDNQAKTDRKKNEDILTTVDKKTVGKSRSRKFKQTNQKTSAEAVKNEKPKSVKKTVQKKRINAAALPSDSEEEHSKPRYKSKQQLKTKLTSKVISSSKPQQETLCKTASSNVLQSFETLTLDDISCGSSCMETSSDEGFFNVNKYQMIREKAQLQHRQKKLFERTQMMENNESFVLPARKKQHQSASDKNSFDARKPTDKRDHDKKLNGREFDASPTKVGRFEK